MRDDIELLCEIINVHFGGFSSIIIRKILVNGQLPLDKLYVLILQSKEAQIYFPNNGKDKFIHFRNSMLMLIQHSCVKYKQIVSTDFCSDSSDNSKITLFEVNADNIFSRLRFPLYLDHVNTLLGEGSKLILAEIMKYGRISTTLLVSELSESVENVEDYLNLLLSYDFISIHNERRRPLNLDENHDSKDVNSVFNDLLLGFNERYNNFVSETGNHELACYDNPTHETSELGLVHADDTMKDNDLRSVNKEELEVGNNDEVIDEIANKVVYLNIKGLHNSIYSSILEEVAKARYNNVLSSVVIRVMSDSKALKKKSDDQGWTVDEINNEILDLINLNPSLKKELDFTDDSKLKNSVLRIMDVLSKHSDEFISFNLSHIGTFYKINLTKMKLLVKYKTVFEYICQRVGSLGSMVWSMMCNPHLLSMNDNIKFSYIEGNKSDTTSNSPTPMPMCPYIEGEVRGRIYWDDATIAERCLLPNNIARNLLYSLSNERFVRIHHSDTVTIESSYGTNTVGNSQSTDSRGSGNKLNATSDTNFNIVNTISQASLNKHGIFYSTCISSTIIEVQLKLFKIILNILTRFRAQSDQIMGYEMRSKHLSQIEMQLFEKLNIGLSSLFYNITQIDRILLILSH